MSSTKSFFYKFWLVKPFLGLQQTRQQLNKIFTSYSNVATSNNILPIFYFISLSLSLSLADLSCHAEGRQASRHLTYACEMQARPHHHLWVNLNLVSIHIFWKKNLY